MSRPRWMAAEALDARPLASLLLPGSHDSGAYRLQERLAPAAAQQSFIASRAAALETLLAATGWMPVIRDISRAQRQPVRRQLEDGIRLLDLRICGAAGEAWIHHGLLGPPLAEVLDDLAAFVERHGELVVVRASHFAMGDLGHEPVVAAVLDRLGDRLVRRSESDGGEPGAMRLGELRDREGSGRVLWFHEPDDGNEVAEADERFWGSSTALYGDHWCPRATSVEQLARCQGQAAAMAAGPFHLQWVLTPQPLLVGFDWLRRQLLLPGAPYGLETLAPRAPIERLLSFLDSLPDAPIAAVSVDMVDDSEFVDLVVRRNVAATV